MEHDPTQPPPAEQWPSDPPPTDQQQHAVLAWLALDADVPARVGVLLVDALRAWAPLRGPHVFPVEPRAGPDCDLQQVLENLWWQLDERAARAAWEDKVVLTEVAGRVGLALASWRCPSSDVDL